MKVFKIPLAVTKEKSSWLRPRPLKVFEHFSAWHCLSPMSPVAKSSPQLQDSLKQFIGKSGVTQSSPSDVSCVERKSY